MLPNLQRKELTSLRIISLNATRTIVAKRLFPTRQLSSPHFHPCHLSPSFPSFRIFLVAPVTSNEEKRSVPRRGINDAPCCVFPVPQILVSRASYSFFSGFRHRAYKALNYIVASMRILQSSVSFLHFPILLHLKNKFWKST